MAATGASLADLAAVMTQLPQVLINVPVGDRDDRVASAPDVAWPRSTGGRGDAR